MPRPNRRLTELAQETARCARPLLPSPELFMGLEISAAGELRLLWWRHQDLGLVAEISASPAGYCPEDSDEGALQDVATALLVYLSGRWPSPPAGLGVITDGTGVAFAPDHPAPSAPGWLERQASGQSQLLTIVPLDPTGPCALLCGATMATRLH
ncbi:hypothetical protein TS85_11185 [Sphingomonas hengshuiensis]|uniref:Uncharacterized protein n=1 Tax=Sphingomonas hengshuiensis TaxID=1609977 RepID=A0A7U5BFT3_9SPHN|nr:hypothetical protein TS85_11185 [Sphingomonas hengshuiensis]